MTIEENRSIADYLPLDIIRKVFEDLNTYKWYNLRLTCRKWYRVTHEKMREFFYFGHLYEHVVDEVIDTLKFLPSVAKHVKILDVNYRSGDFEWDVQTLLEAAYEHCPNIVKITSGEEEYIEEPELIYEVALEAINKGFLRHLEALPVVYGWNLSTFIPLACAIRSRLKCIDIKSPNRDEDTFSESVLKKFGNGIWIAQFPKLESFQLEWDKNITFRV